MHYAAKYGHPDLCRILVGKGAYPGKRNEIGKTPYDVSDNHTVRQYLLPLQFQSERNLNGSNDGADNNGMATLQTSSGNYNVNTNQTQGQYTGFQSHNAPQLHAPNPHHLSPQPLPVAHTPHQYSHTVAHTVAPLNAAPFPDEVKSDYQIPNPTAFHNQGPIVVDAGGSPFSKINSISAVPNVSTNFAPSAVPVPHTGPVVLNQNPETPLFNAVSLQPQRPQININVNHQESLFPAQSQVPQINTSWSSAPPNGPTPPHVASPSHRANAASTSSGFHRIIQPGTYTCRYTRLHISVISLL